MKRTLAGYRRLGALPTLSAALVLQACSTETAAPQEGLPVVRACFISADSSVPVTLEVASAAEQRRTGLMGRTGLADSAGMLFQYREARGAEHGFWMYNTLIPLDIAYLDQSGTIVSIRTMAPCPPADGSRCPAYPAGVPFISAVEMNAGFFEQHGLDTGDRLEVDPKRCPAS